MDNPTCDAALKEICSVVLPKEKSKSVSAAIKGPSLHVGGFDFGDDEYHRAQMMFNAMPPNRSPPYSRNSMSPRKRNAGEMMATSLNDVDGDRGSMYDHSKMRHLNDHNRERYGDYR